MPKVKEEKKPTEMQFELTDWGYKIVDPADMQQRGAGVGLDPIPFHPELKFLDGCPKCKGGIYKVEKVKPKLCSSCLKEQREIERIEADRKAKEKEKERLAKLEEETKKKK